MPNRRILLKSALLSCILVQVACDSGVPAGKTHLRYMAWGNPEQMALEEKLCQEFNRQNPDLHVTFFRVPGSAYLNKAVVMMASRTAPDIIRIDHYNFPSLVRKDYFYDMTPLAENDPTFNRDEFFPITLSEGTHEGKLYGLNVLFGAQLIYYNKKMIREAGLEDPYQLWQKGEWTWERFRSHAKAMTGTGKDGIKRFGCRVPTFPETVPVVWSFGGDFLNEDRTKSLVASDGTIEAYQFLADLRWKDSCAPTPAQAANSAYTFESGKLGLDFGWMGNTPRYRGTIKDFDWDICPMPIGKAGFATMVKGNQLVIYKETKHPEAAWRFVRYMTGPAVERELYIKNRRSFPTRKEIAFSDEFLNSTAPPFQMDSMVKSVQGGRELPITARWNEWVQVFNAAQDDLFSGRERSAAKAMAKAQKAIDEVLADEEGY